MPPCFLYAAFCVQTRMSWRRNSGASTKSGPWVVTALQGIGIFTLPHSSHAKGFSPERSEHQEVRLGLLATDLCGF
eukprot:758484-Hanusia_phi.AAC.4